MTNGLEKVQINKNLGSKEALQREFISQLDPSHHKGEGYKAQELSFEFWKTFFNFLLENLKFLSPSS